MIEHVRRRALLSNSISEVLVATCDDDIASVVRGFGGKVVMTANTHKNGTTRVAEAIKNIDCSHLILIQGDEPLLLPRHIDTFVEAIKSEPMGAAWNATGPIEKIEELDQRSSVKCAIGSMDRILYCFRRSPCCSDFNNQKIFIRKILGIIAYRKDFLFQLTDLTASPIEQAEFIEQMRIIEYGHILRSVPVSPSVASVNEPAEVDVVLEYIQNDAEQRMLLEQLLQMSPSI